MFQKTTAFRIFFWASLILIGFFIFFPLLWLINTALKPTSETFSSYFFVGPLTLDNIIHIVTDPKIMGYLKNSLIVSFGSSLMATIVCAFAGYSFAKFRYRGRKFVMGMFMMSQAFPQAILLLSIYSLMNKTGLLGSYWALLISYVVFTLPVGTWTLKSYFDNIPDSLIESAKIDGAGHWRIMMKIVFPMAVPGMISIAIYGFVWSWNDLLYSMTLVTDTAKRTLASGLVMTFLGEASTNWGYEENGKAVPGYRDLIDELSGEFPLGQPIIGEQKQKDFIKLYGNILRLKNILSAFDQFAGNEILPERDFQDYQSVYLDLYQAYRPKTDGDKENINDDITFEIELIRQVEINIDYILMLVMKYHESNCKDKSILGTIDRAIDSSIQLRSKKDLIHGFISTVNAATDVDRDWQSYVQQQKQQELEQIIAEEKLKPTEAQRFIANAFRDGALKTTGTDIDQILPPVSRFGGGNRTEKKKTIIQRLAQFFEMCLSA